MTDVSTEGAVDTQVSERRVNKGGRPASQPFGITAPVGSREYHRQYTRAYLERRREERNIHAKQVAREVTQPRMGQHVTLAELSKAQGWPTDSKSLESLRRRLLARQKMVGVVILFKLSIARGVHGGRYYTTVPLMRRYCSELFDEASEGAGVIKTLMASVKAELADLRALVKSLKVRIKTLENRSPDRPSTSG